MVIYRRYYGTRMMMLTILGVFHGAMVLAGYATDFPVRLGAGDQDAGQAEGVTAVGKRRCQHGGGVPPGGGDGERRGIRCARRGG
jgi:hypothetical protein